MHAEDSIDIEAPADVVWRVYADVERWPDWTASMDEVTFVRGDALADGAEVRIKQPRLPRVTWVVTELRPGASWTWEARSPGALTVARHVVTATDDGTTRVEQSIDQTGPARRAGRPGDRRPDPPIPADGGRGPQGDGRGPLIGPDERPANAGR